MMILFIIKESFQLIAGGVNLRRGKMLKGALFSGKVCTTILFLSLIVLVMLPELKLNIVKIIAVVDVAFMLAAFVDYIIAYFFVESRFQSINE